MITEEQIQAIVRRIVQGYAPDKIILFGSYAYGEPTEFSDLDLLIIKADDQAEKRQRQREIKQLVRTDLWVVDMDIVVLNEAELQAVSINRCCREYVALRHGRCLHGELVRPLAIATDIPHNSAEKATIQRLVKSAEQDLAAAREIALPLNYFDAVARGCQSGAEKMLKARLITLKAAPPAGHDLNLLLAALARLEHVEAATWRRAELLAPFAVLFHDYNFEMPHPPTTLQLLEAATSLYHAFAPSPQQELA